MKTAPTLKSGDQISRYRVVGPLGAGGMGEVYRAKDESLERDVALKILPPTVVRSEERLRRFVLEAKSASSLNHPNIVTIYEIGQAEVGSAPLHFISMELVTGDTLNTKIHAEKTSLKELLGWLAQAAEGLAKAHAAGIVHRDLKPGNIMVTHDGYAKVLDFGLAKLTERQPADADKSSAPTMTDDITGDGVVLGTAGYMSPEQVQGKSVDHRSDIFSLGCILYEAATRKQPFAAESGVETMHKILHDTPTPVEELNAQAPAELRRLIRRCLAKDSNRRLDSMKALAIELSEIAEDFDTLSASASSGSGAQAIAPAKRRLAIVPLAAVVAIVAAAILGGVWFTQWREDHAPAAVFRSVKMTTVPGHGDVNSAALSPDGRYLATVSGPPERKSIWMRQVSTGSDVEVFHGTTAPAGLSFSPDGEHLFFLNPDAQIPGSTALYEIATLGGPPIKRASRVDSRAAFSADGARVCFERDRTEKRLTELIVLELSSGQERILSTIPEPAHLTSHPAWSPRGDKLAVGERHPSSGTIAGSLLVFRTSDGRRETIPTDSRVVVHDVVWLPDDNGLVISAQLLPTLRRDLSLLSYPSGSTRAITSDPNDYSSLSIASNGASLAAIRRSSVLNLWEADARANGGIRQLTSATAPENAIMTYAVGQDGSIVFRSHDVAHPLWRIGPERSAAVALATEWTLGRDYLTGFNVLADGGVVVTHYGANHIPHIWRMDADGSSPRQLTTGSGEVLTDLSPDGKTLIFRPPDGAGPPEMWSVSIAGGEPTRLSSGTFALGTQRFSPDGTRIGYFEASPVDDERRTKTWQVISAKDGRLISAISLDVDAEQQAFFRDIEWTADGKALTFLNKLRGVGNVYRQRVDGVRSEPVTRFDEGKVLAHEWSPDGTRLLLLRGDERTDLWMTVADGSDAVQLTDFKTGQIQRADWIPPDGRRILFTYGQRTSDVVLIKDFR